MANDYRDEYNRPAVAGKTYIPSAREDFGQPPLPNAALQAADDGSIDGGQFIVTPVGLIFKDTATRADWESAPALIKKLENATTWAIADWCAQGEKKWGESYTNLAEMTGYKVHTLENMAYVAKRVEFSRRKEKLSFSHHAAVASLDPDQQIKQLKDAIDGEWTVTELRYAIHGRPTPLAMVERVARSFAQNQQRYQQIEKRLARVGRDEALQLDTLIENEIEQLRKLQSHVRKMQRGKARAGQD